MCGRAELMVQSLGISGIQHDAFELLASVCQETGDGKPHVIGGQQSEIH
jgi:hypothetical protein